MTLRSCFRIPAATLATVATQAPSMSAAAAMRVPGLGALELSGKGSSVVARETRCIVGDQDFSSRTFSSS
jgi:hypothetical protein